MILALLDEDNIYIMNIGPNYYSASSVDDYYNWFLNEYVNTLGIKDPEYSTYTLIDGKHCIPLPYVNSPKEDKLYLLIDYYTSGVEIDLYSNNPGVPKIDLYNDYYLNSNNFYHRRNSGSALTATDGKEKLVIDTRYLYTHRFYNISYTGAEVTEDNKILIAPLFFVSSFVDQINGKYSDGVISFKDRCSGIILDNYKQYIYQDFGASSFSPQLYTQNDHSIVLQKVQFGRQKAEWVYLTDIEKNNKLIELVDNEKMVEYNDNWDKSNIYKEKNFFFLGLGLNKKYNYSSDTYYENYFNDAIEKGRLRPVIEDKIGEGRKNYKTKGYLEFSSDEDFRLHATRGWNGVIEYSIDNKKTWVEWDGSELSGSAEQSICLRGTGNTKISGGFNRSWSFTGKYIKGNIETLLDYQTVLNKEHPRMSDYCFSYLFENCASLIEAPDLLATTLADHCYKEMFAYCTSLIKAPKMPATTLADYCCRAMFYNCTSLTQAPDLPATTLAERCYQYMFYNCTSLTQAPDLPATTLAEWCYSSMFEGCKSLTKAPKLSAITLAEWCCEMMFRGCYSLAQAPALPATTLADGCYSSMFSYCKSLAQIPRLPATTLAKWCYNSMFESCQRIKISKTQTSEYNNIYRIPILGSGTISSSADLQYMFYKTGGTFTGNPLINTTYYTSNEIV